jgi:hypothetical protein
MFLKFNSNYWDNVLVSKIVGPLWGHYGGLYKKITALWMGFPAEGHI